MTLPDANLPPAQEAPGKDQAAKAASAPTPSTVAGTGAPAGNPNDRPGSAGQPTQDPKGSHTVGTATSTTVHDPAASARTASVGSKIEEQARDEHMEAQKKAAEAAGKETEAKHNLANAQDKRKVLFDGVIEAHDNHMKEIAGLSSQVAQGTPVSGAQLQALQAASKGLLDAIQKLRG